MTSTRKCLLLGVDKCIEWREYYVCPKCPGKELPYEEYTGVCHVSGSYFKENIRKQKRVCQFSQNFENGYLKEIPNRASYFDGTNYKPKKTELIDYFDLVWTKNPQF